MKSAVGLFLAFVGTCDALRAGVATQNGKIVSETLRISRAESRRPVYREVRGVGADMRRKPMKTKKAAECVRMPAS